MIERVRARVGWLLSWLRVGVALASLSACAAEPVGLDRDDETDRILVMLPLPAPHFRADSGYASSYDDALGRSARRRAVLRLARSYRLELLFDWPMPLLNVHCYELRLPSGVIAAPVLRSLGNEPAVAWAQPMNLYRAQGEPAAAPGLMQSWRLADLHQLATGRGASVAVIDSSVDASHPALAAQVSARENFVRGRPDMAERHGTAVAGLIAARADQASAIVGVAPQARIMALRACWQVISGATLCNSLSLALALQFAVVHQAQVINMSLSGPRDPLLERLLDAALAHGSAVVAAIDRSAGDGGFPASHPGVVAVADDGPGNSLPPHTLQAPGRDLPTTAPGAGWSLVSGSSFAAAQVSGLMALLSELRGGQPPLGEGKALVQSLAGGVDACATLMRISGSCVCSCTTSSAASPGLR